MVASIKLYIDFTKSGLISKKEQSLCHVVWREFCTEVWAGPKVN